MRKSINKKLRFEVFKRDSFTCQYCGAKAPDVILHVDHIEPVSKGGGDDILNLITSCQPCNAGKSDRRLDDATVLAAQRAQLEELNERREQLEMLLKWRDAVETISEDEAIAVVEVIDGLLSGYGHSLNEAGVSDVRKWVRKFGVKLTLDAIDKAASQYLEKDWSDTSVSRFIGGIPRIAHWQSRGGMPDTKRQAYYIRGILNKRLSYVNQQTAIELVEVAARAGVEIEWITGIAKQARSWTQFRDWCEQATYEANNGED